jgi:hypothetical protein
MNVKNGAPAQPEDDILAPALDPHNASFSHGPEEGPLRAPQALSQADLHVGKFQVLNSFPQAANDRFHFGQLRQAFSSFRFTG